MEQMHQGEIIADFFRNLGEDKFINYSINSSANYNHLSYWNWPT